MFLVSEAPKVEVVKKYESRTELDEYKTDEQRKEEVIKTMTCFMAAGVSRYFLCMP